MLCFRLCVAHWALSSDGVYSESKGLLAISYITQGVTQGAINNQSSIQMYCRRDLGGFFYRGKAPVNNSRHCLQRNFPKSWLMFAAYFNRLIIKEYLLLFRLLVTSEVHVGILRHMYTCTSDVNRDYSRWNIKRTKLNMTYFYYPVRYSVVLFY